MASGNVFRFSRGDPMVTPDDDDEVPFEPPPAQKPTARAIPRPPLDSAADRGERLPESHSRARIVTEYAIIQPRTRRPR